MIHIGEHRNIINILGACTQAKKLLLIMEFAVHGSLLQFLRERRPVYRPTWTKTVNDPKQEYTLVDVVMAAYQISRGLEFLASKKVNLWFSVLLGQLNTMDITHAKSSLKRFLSLLHFFGTKPRLKVVLRGK